VGITPTYVLPVSKDDIPKTGIGKIQRPQLKKAFEAGQYKELLKELDRRMGNANTLPDWFYRKSWQRCALLQRPLQVTEGVVLVLADEAGMGKALYEQLRQQQQRCIYVERGANFERLGEDHYQIEPNLEADYDLLGAALTVERVMVKYVVHLWGYHPNRTEDAQGEHLKATHNRVLSMLHLVQTLERGWSQEERPEGEHIKLVVVSTQVDAIQGDEALAYEQAPVVGLLKTFERELPWLQCVHVDVPADDQTQNVLHVLQELYHNREEPEVAYRAGQRFAARLEHVDWSAEATHPLPLVQQGFYLLSGGLGGLGYELARHLLQEYQARLLLVGRTPIAQGQGSTTTTASAETPATRLTQLQELARHGGEVHYVAVDVCDLAGLQQAVQQAQHEWERPLDGIFHLAGEFHELVLLRETAQQIEQTLRPKVEGTWTLHQLLKDRPGALFVSYSSVNAFFGGRGVGAYAAANCFLESFAQYQRSHCGLQSYCVSWSMWDEVGMSRGYQFKEFSQARGYHFIASHRGWYSLLTVLHHTSATVLVGLDGHNQHIRPVLVGTGYALQEAVAYVAPGLQRGSQQGWPAWWGTQPGNYHLVTRAALPLKETGEVDVERLGGQNHVSEFTVKQEPRTEMEQQILEIWRQVLKNPQIGVLDNFFELGGHSLLATQVVARMQRVFQIGIPVRNIFEHPTVADLAQMLERQHQQSYTAPPLLPVSRDQRLPLSFAQQRLWFLDQLEPGSTAYAIPSAVRLQGPLDPVALEQALYEVILRHENLRTTFPSLEGEPIQHIHSEPQTRLVTQDLRSLPLEEREARAHFLAQQEVERPFDLANGPLLRASLLLLGEQDQVLLVTMHHIISDGWSMGILIRELTIKYGALLRGDVVATVLPPLPVQYADYAFWQRSWLQGEVLEQQLDYWREQLGGVAPLELPIDHPRPAIQGFRGERQRVQLSAELSQELQALSQREGATLFMTLLASFQILLSRYSGQHDIAVGSPIANRTHEEVEGLIGLLTNMLVLRTQFSDDPTFVDMLERVRGVALGAYSHRDLPFEQVVEALQPERDRSRSPLFQVLFILQPTAEKVETVQASVKIESFAFEQHTAKFELSLIVVENKQGLIVTLEYNSDLFESATITRMLSHWQRLLEGIVANPQQKLSELPLLTGQERQQMLVEWNKTDAEYQQQTLHEAFEQQVARTPDAIALVFENQALTYEALNQFANRLAHHLRRQGVGPDVLVGIRMERSLELMVGLLGILKAGGAYVPLDPTYPADRLVFILEDAQISILLTQSHISEAVSTISQQMICLDQAWHELAGEPMSNLPNITMLENAAYCIYTSGSTGNPKGVVLSHRNVMNFFTGMDQQIGEDQPGIWLAVTSISFDISVLELFWTLLRGFRVILQEKLDEIKAVPASIITKPIDFSLFYFANDAGEKKQDKYRLLLEGAKFADQHGFSAVWTPERHFHAFGGLYPNPSITSAMIAAVTERVQIRAGSVVLPLHSPIRVVEEWSMVDNVSRGRVGVSFASGWQSNDFVLAPDKYANRKEAMFHSIETVRRLWRGEKMALPDGAGNVIDISTLPRPIQPELPVWVTSGGTPETFRMAGEIGANLLTHLLGQDLDELADKIAIYRTAWNEYGHAAQGKTGHVTLMMHTYINTDLENVRETVRQPFTEYLRSSIGLIQTMAKSMGMNMRSKDFSDADMGALLAHAFERYFVTSGLFGTVESCLELVQRLKAIGVDEVGCLIDFGVDEDLVLTSLHQLAQLKDLSNVQDDERYDDYSVPAQIVRHGVTHLQCTPSLARTLQLMPEIVEGLQGLHKLMLGGEALPLSLVKDIESVSQATLHNMYGPTETTIWSTTALLEKGCDQVSIGSPIANTQIYLLDALLQPVPVGVPGELYIGGMGVARGYHHRPDLTAERFIPDLWSTVPGARLYRTGDTARYLSEGSIEYLGRGDQQIKLRGYRIELGEVEATLLRHPAIRQAVVVVREQTTGDKQLVAYLVPAQDAAVPSNVQLRHLLKESLPDYMIPSAFAILDTLPLTPNGKIDRRTLVTLRPQTQAETSRHVPPRDEIEYQLRDIWEELLDVSPISVTDNFFDLGGHSILAVKLMARIKHTFNRDLPLGTLFQRQTVADLATFLREGQGAYVEQPILVPLQPRGSCTPFFCVHATGGEVFGYAGLAHYLGEEQPFYGLRMPDPREHDEEFRTLEGIAACYVAAIQELQPQGPYQLGGWSGGGLVAYEIAQQLQRQGHEVRLLALMDSRPPVSDWNMAREEEEGSDDIALTRYFTRRYRLTLPEELAQRGAAEEQFAYVCEQLKQRHLVPQDAEPEHLRQVALTVKVMESTAVRYTLQPYPGHLTLFCSTEVAASEAGRDPAITDAVIGDWEALAQQGVEVHRVPGNHITMVEKPHVEGLAAALTQCLDQEQH
jgi:natural product biosynthesis luciferase-like monooxygenase protein